MRRRHLFEFEDQAWLPRSLRSLVTQALQQIHDVLGIYESTLPILVSTLNRNRTARIVDLCSGAGGPWLRLHRRVAAQVPGLEVTLTDLYPEPDTVAGWGEGTNVVSYHVESVDAAQVPSELDGVRTMFTAFHHFAPQDARRILADAASKRVPIVVFEFTQRTLLNILFAAVVGAVSLPLVLPWLRPLRSSHLLWTYLLPVGPLIYAWDAAVSNLRTYSVSELVAMANTVGDPTYEWEAGQLRVPGAPVPILYLIGHPASAGDLLLSS